MRITILLREKIRALIFDVDGTLAETEDFHRKAFNQAFSLKKIDWCWSQVVYKKLLAITGGKERIQHFNNKYLPTPLPLNNEEVESLHSKKNIIYSKLIETGVIKLRPGVKELLKRAKDYGKDLAIASSTSRSNLDSLIKACFNDKPENIFSFIATGDMVKEKKPKPELYDLVLKHMNLKPNECLAFEDSEVGLSSAKQANIETIVSPSYYNLGDSFEDADYLVKSFIFKTLPVSLRTRIES